MTTSCVTTGVPSARAPLVWRRRTRPCLLCSQPRRPSRLRYSRWRAPRILRYATWSATTRRARSSTRRRIFETAALGDPEVVRDRLLPPALLGQGEDLVLAAPNHAPRLGAALPPHGRSGTVGAAARSRGYASDPPVARRPPGRGRARWPVNASQRVRVTWMYCGSRSMATHVRAVFSPRSPRSRCRRTGRTGCRAWWCGGESVAPTAGRASGCHGHSRRSRRPVSRRTG